MNMSICDAAAELGISETRLRKTLAEGHFPTLQQMRATRTGLRKTTLIPPETLALLHTHFQSPLLEASAEPLASAPPAAHAELLPPPREAVSVPSVEVEVGETRCDAAPQSAGSVPVAQFHALLFQHNVLREELTRVTHYLDDCDRLLGEMVKTIAALEARTRQLEEVRPMRRSAGDALSGALRSVSSGLQNVLQVRQAASSSGMLAPAEVYYANTLAGR